jgi:hypothetical protein
LSNSASGNDVSRETLRDPFSLALNSNSERGVWQTAGTFQEAQEDVSRETNNPQRAPH